MKRICCTALVLVCLLAPCRALAAETAVQTDTAESVENAWYSESVGFCMERGMLKPDERAPFDPDALLSKIEFIVMVSRAYGLYDEGSEPFYIAQEGHFSAAVEHGIFTAEEFPVEEWAHPLGRFEAASICYRSLLTTGGYVEDGNEVYIDHTADKEAIPQPYRQAVNGIYATGIMNGMDAGLTFQGWACVTKAQGCAILHRLLDEQTRKTPTVFADYGQLLGAYTTSYGENNGTGIPEHQEGRIFNIRKAGAILNGVVVAPGEAFSFNGTIGNPSKANGYKQIMMMSNGKMVHSFYGSGLCQISTTLFNAALKANMTIIERHNHGLKSTYISPGADSTIYYPGVDLKWVNPFSCPVRIIFDVDPLAETLTTKIYGSTEVYVPEVIWDIVENGGVYTLNRYADGVLNYSCTSKYRD